MADVRPVRAGFGLGRVGDRIFSGLAVLFGLVVIGLFVSVALMLVKEAWPAIHEFGLAFVWGHEWDPSGGRFGAYPYLIGTLGSSLIALIVAVPIAILTAVALADLLPRRLSSVLGLFVELLAAVPSIVFGVWGARVISPFVRRIAHGQTFGPSVLSAGLVLAVMILPIITALSRDLIRAVPRQQRDAGLALGATQWEVTGRVVLPYARGGISAAIILGFGRAIGETMAVVMTIGNNPRVWHSIFEPGATFASVIANQFGDPSGPLHFASLVYLGLILLVVSLVLNIVSRIIIRRYAREASA